MSLTTTVSLLCKQLQVDACFILGSDLHALENPVFPFHFRHMLSGFTGSAGTLVCTSTGEHMLFSDGRYEQALQRQKLPYHIRSERDWDSQMMWLSQHKNIHRVGLCSYQCNHTQFSSLRMLAKKASFLLIPLSLQKLIIASIHASSKYARYYEHYDYSLKKTTHSTESTVCIPLPKQLVLTHPHSIHDRTVISSTLSHNTISPLQRIISFLQKQNLTAYFTTQLHEIAYLLGVRGNMQEYMLFPAMMLLCMEHPLEQEHITTDTVQKMNIKIVLWIPQKMQHTKNIHIIQKQIRLQLNTSIPLIIKHYEEALYNMPEHIYPFFTQTSSVAVDTSIVPSVICNTMNVSKYKKNIKKIISPIKKWRSIYAPSHIRSLKKVLTFDTIALLESVALMYAHLQQNTTITESQVEDYLLQYKKQCPQFVQSSFNTIAAVGKNSTLPHYNPNKSRKKLSIQQPLLIDCGSHYRFGTTDITRVFYFDNSPPPLLVEDYTLVLKAHITLVLSQFSSQTTGKKIDAKIKKVFAHYERTCNHGIGHGVGFCSDVHDGYFTIGQHSSSTPADSLVLSNEPGYYRIGKWGIRLENLIMSHIKDTTLTFSTLTYFPFQETLIDRSLLTVQEIQWLDTYQRACKKNYMHTLSKRAKAFLTMLIQC